MSPSIRASSIFFAAPMPPAENAPRRSSDHASWSRKRVFSSAAIAAGSRAPRPICSRQRFALSIALPPAIANETVTSGARVTAQPISRNWPPPVCVHPAGVSHCQRSPPAAFSARSASARPSREPAKRSSVVAAGRAGPASFFSRTSSIATVRSSPPHPAGRSSRAAAIAARGRRRDIGGIVGGRREAPPQGTPSAAVYFPGTAGAGAGAGLRAGATGAAGPTTTSTSASGRTCFFATRTTSSAVTRSTSAR